MASGRPHCSFCREMYGAPGAGLAPAGAGARQFFCGRAQCYAAYYQRTSGAALRTACWERDRGVCRREGCGRDTEALAQALRPLTPAERRARLAADGFALSRQRREAICDVKRAFRTGRGSQLWEADHTVAVAEGGGECGAENLRTLCVPCHAEETKARATGGGPFSYPLLLFGLYGESLVKYTGARES